MGLGHVMHVGRCRTYAVYHARLRIPVGVAILLMAACAENPPTVEVFGPSTAKVNKDVYLESKATGATPLFGTVGFRWQRRTGNTGDWTVMRNEVRGADVNGNAIDWWIDTMPQAPGTLQYRVTASIWQTHNIDEVVYRVDSHEVKVTE